MIPRFTCPGCMRQQLLAPNVMAPRDRMSVLVVCPDCSVTAVHVPHPSQRAAVVGCAQVVLETEVASFRRGLSDVRLAEFVEGGT